MSSFKFATAGGLLAALAWAAPAAAQQSNLSGFMGYPTPPVNTSGGSYVVGPSLNGAGATYSYVQQNPGAGMGMSPNAYYSMNYFTNTPMSPTYPHAYSSNYSSHYVEPSLPPVNYATTPAYPSSYANANSSYYRARRTGPIRGMFGRR